MQPQHLAQPPLVIHATAALPPHSCRLESSPYAMRGNCDKVSSRNTQVSLTSKSGSHRHEAVSDPSNSYRRLRCQRASKCWPHSALSQSFRHAHQSSKKNMLWLHPSQSRLSQYTQASTSKTCRGQASAPVLSPVLSDAPRMAPFVRRASC